VEAKPTAGASWIFGDELVDDELGSIGKTFDQAEVKGADGAWIGRGSGGERTGSEDDLQTFPTALNLRVEPQPRHGVGHPGEDLLRFTGRASELLRHPSTDGDRCVSGADDLGKQQTETFVGPHDPPSTLGARVDLIDQAGPTGPAPLNGRFDDEPGVDELGEVLADRVVVQPEVVRELCHIDRLAGVGQVPKHGMAGGIA